VLTSLAASLAVFISFFCFGLVAFNTLGTWYPGKVRSRSPQQHRRSKLPATVNCLAANSYSPHSGTKSISHLRL
jgi:hypothetical protein